MGLKQIIRDCLIDWRRNRKYNDDFTAKHYIKMTNCPLLSAKDKKTIDLYWAKFHIKFKEYEWFRMYYHVTGIHDPRFVPQPVAEELLSKYYNRQEFASAYADKNMFSFILPTIKFPNTLGKRINGRYLDNKGNCFGEEVNSSYIDTVFNEIYYIKSINETVKKGIEIVIKEANGSFQGKGVRIYTIKEPSDLKAVIERYHSKDYIIQEKIIQHPFFAQFNPDSVNIIRITTWRIGDQIHILCPCIRFGVKGSATDVSFINGTEVLNAIKIHNDGVIDDYYITLAGEKILLPKDYTRTVPKWSSIIDLISKNAMNLHYFGFIGWDVTVDENDSIICLEYNIKCPGTVVYQFAHGPLAGDNTDLLLEFLTKDENIELIPKCIRI